MNGGGEKTKVLGLRMLILAAVAIVAVAFLLAGPLASLAPAQNETRSSDQRVIVRANEDDSEVRAAVRVDGDGRRELLLRDLDDDELGELRRLDLDFEEFDDDDDDDFRNVTIDCEVIDGRFRGLRDNLLFDEPFDRGLSAPGIDGPGSLDSATANQYNPDIIPVPFPVFIPIEVLRTCFVEEDIEHDDRRREEIVITNRTGRQDGRVLDTSRIPKLPFTGGLSLPGVASIAGLALFGAGAVVAVWRVGSRRGPGGD